MTVLGRCMEPRGDRVSSTSESRRNRCGAEVFGSVPERYMTDERPRGAFWGRCGNHFPAGTIRWRFRAAAGKDWLCTVPVDILFLEDLLPNIIKDRGLARWQIS